MLLFGGVYKDLPIFETCVTTRKIEIRRLKMSMIFFLELREY